MDVTAIALTANSSDTFQRKGPFSFELNDLSEFGENWRYIARSEDFFSCFSNDLYFHKLICYFVAKDSTLLTFPSYESMNFNSKWEPTSFDNYFVKFFDYVGLNKTPYENDLCVIIFILNQIAIIEKEKNISLGGRTVELYKHLYFTAVTALRYYSNISFNYSCSTGARRQASDQIIEILLELKIHSGKYKKINSNVCRLYDFFMVWKINMFSELASNNISDPMKPSSQLDAIWWIDSDLKSQFNDINKIEFDGFIKDLLTAFEGI